MACNVQDAAMQMALAQAMQQAKSSSLEARLAALESRARSSPQGTPDSRRMTHDIAMLGYEAVRAEDLNSILARLVSIHPQTQPGGHMHLKQCLQGLDGCLANLCSRTHCL